MSANKKSDRGKITTSALELRSCKCCGTNCTSPEPRRAAARDTAGRARWSWNLGCPNLHLMIKCKAACPVGH